MPSVGGLQAVTGLQTGDLALLCEHPATRAYLERRLADYNAAQPGSSTAVRRIAFMRRAPDAQRHEISDKGTINQRLAADNRREEIAALYANPPGGHVIAAPD